MATSDEGVSHPPSRGRQTGGFASPRHHLAPQDSPGHHSGAASSGPATELSVSDASSWVLNGIKNDKEVNYPTSAAEILDLLQEKVAILSGGRDKEGQSIITFPAQSKTYVYQRETIRRVVQYLACIPALEVRELGFSVIVDGRVSGWNSSKLILRTLQEALPGQVHVVYLVQPGQFWQKQQTTRGHNREKAKLEFTTVKVSNIEKLTRYVDGSQLTNDLGGFLPYDHNQWLTLRQDLEHFVSLVSSLMEHTTHIEQQIRLEQEGPDSESSEDQLKHHLPLQDMVRRAPQDALRKGNELLVTLERERDEAVTGTAMTPDKINAVSIVRRLLDKIKHRQSDLEDMWRRKKSALEQTLQLKNFEKSVQKVKSWLKTRGEDMVLGQTDIGTSMDAVQTLMECHEKAEGKARLQYNLLTQLRRSADRYSGEQHFAAENIQKQVSKLSAKFTRFENKMAARRRILEFSLQFHTSLRQWKEQCEVVASVLKQERAGQEKAESRDDLVLQLQQIGDVVVEEARSLLELLIRTMRAGGMGVASENGGGGGRGSIHAPDYSQGLAHVKRLMEEVENHRRRLGQLAEARKVQAEQLKQIDACEKDAKQETRWLEYMRSQLSSTHGDVGVSVATVDKLVGEHCKFIETAQKSYKYGCGLIAAAEKSRRSFQISVEPTTTLLSEHGVSWKKLSEGAKEVGERLKMARHFHGLYEKIMASFTDWMRPLNELPKTPELVEEKLQDISDHHQQLFQDTQECADTGRSLANRLSRPVLQEPEFVALNERLQESQRFLHAKVSELEKRSEEVQHILPQQEALLREFITYCHFERKIEHILLWLQKTGLKKLPMFSTVGDDRDSVQKQVLEFESFREEADSLSVQVSELDSTAADIEAQIGGFKSDLTRKTGSLRAVWQKFLQRVQNRGSVLNLALSFHTTLEQISSSTSYLKSALTPRAIDDGGGTPYLNELFPTKEELDELFSSLVKDGRGLVEIFSNPPVDPSDSVIRIRSRLKNLRDEKVQIDRMWEEAWRGGEHGNPIGQGSLEEDATPSANGHVTSGVEGGPLEDNSSSSLSSGESAPTKVQTSPSKASGKVKKVSQGGVVSRKNSDKFSELEEEAYEYLGWLESEYESFIMSHSNFHDTAEKATALKAEYEEFLEKVEPTCRKVERVIDLLTQLSPKAPTLSSTIDQLCQVVSDRVKKIKDILTQCSTILDMFAKFCILYKELDTCLQNLEDLVCEDISSDITVAAAQKLLDSGQPLATDIDKDYQTAKDLGEAFLTLISEVLCYRGGPKLTVGGACTSVAVDLGDLEGRGPDILDRWDDCRRQLSELLDWQAFKQTSDQVCAWLSESAEMFLQQHTDTGTSLEMAEDLLAEHQEFHIRAERTAAEVKMLLSRSEQLLQDDHTHSGTILEITSSLRNLHGNFQSRFKERKTLLEGTVEFYHTAIKLKRDMQEAIEMCRTYSGTDLPGRLKIASISSHLSNLAHHGHTLTVTLTRSPLSPSTVLSPTSKRGSWGRRGKDHRFEDTASASEIAVNQTIESLQKLFDDYKKHFERRILPQSAMAFKAAEKSLGREVDAVSANKEAKIINGETERKDVPVAQKHGESLLRERDSQMVALGVRNQIAALNQKSRSIDETPPPEPGLSYNMGAPRPRSKTADEVVLRRSPVGQRNKSTSSDEDVPVRRRALSKAERTKKIEDIKKLFESSELEDLTSAMSETPAWSPRSLSTPKVSPAPSSPRKEKQKVVAVEKGGVDERVQVASPTPVIMVSPPPGATRTRLHTAPTVIRTVIKDHTPPPKQQVITITHSNASLEDRQNKQDSEKMQNNKDVEPTDGRSSRTGKSVATPLSPTHAQPKTTTTKVKGRGWGVLTGKVSSLREMFDSQSKSDESSSSSLRANSLGRKKKDKKEHSQKSSDSRDGSLNRRERDRDSCEPVLSPETIEDLSLSLSLSDPRSASGMSQRRQSQDEEFSGTLSRTSSVAMGTLSEVTETYRVACRPSLDLAGTSGGGVAILYDAHYAEESRALHPKSPPRPRLPSPSVLTPSPHQTPPPRPPTPGDYYYNNLDESGTSFSAMGMDDSDCEFEEAGCPSESGSSLLDHSDLEWLEDQTLEWNEDDKVEENFGMDQVDHPSAEPRPLKSLSLVLQELLVTEEAYVRSLEVLSEMYLPLLSSSSPHLPSFLQGADTTVMANIQDLYDFQRSFYEDLSLVEGSVEGTCNSFMQNEERFDVYVPFLTNMERGLKILKDYGGTFLSDYQRQLGDSMSVIGHYCSPRVRLVHYLEMLRDLAYCAQKQYLHGVSLVKETVKTVVRILRRVDNAMVLSRLRDCPHQVVHDGHMICRDQFLVYSTRTKKKRKSQELCVMLHPEVVVLAKRKKEKSKGKKEHYLEFIEALETSQLHLLETYKKDNEKFALCSGRLSADNLLVMQAVHDPTLIKAMWLQELWPILQKREISREVLVREDELPAPPFFKGVTLSRAMPIKPAREEAWLSRSTSVRRRLSVRRRKRKEQGSKDSTEMEEEGLANLPLSLAKREAMIRSSVISSESSSSTITSSSSQPSHVDIRLVSLSTNGHFVPDEQQDDDLWIVTRASRVEGEGFLSVEPGQMVELLDDSQKGAWFVLTIPRFKGEEQMEGFVEQKCLQRVKEVTRESKLVGDSSSQPHPGAQVELFEAETGQEVPQENTSSGSGTSVEVGGASEDMDGRQALPETPTNKLSQSENQEIDVTDTSKVSEVTTGQSLTLLLKAPPSLPPPDLDMLLTTSQASLTDLTSMNSSQAHYHTTSTLQSNSETSFADEIGSGLEDNPIKTSSPVDTSQETPKSLPLPPPPPPPGYSQPSERPPPLHHLTLMSGESLSSSLQSLPSSFSPKAVPSSHLQLNFLGYNPMMIPTHTLSQPNIPKIKVDSTHLPAHLKTRPRGELHQLQRATVKASPDTSMEDFDPVEVFVAIADFQGVEESNVSLRAGQCVQVLDSSRKDWWLVLSAESGEQGWVPANYLEQRVMEGPGSPPPEPFEDENGELAHLMMKGQSASELQLNRRELYSAPFLADEKGWLPEPSQHQLEGMFSIQIPYVAVTEIQGACLEQLSLIQDQPVRVLDSCRGDWWLVCTIPEDEETEGVAGDRPKEGWVRADLLAEEDIQEDTLDTSISTNDVGEGEGLAIRIAPQVIVSPSSHTQWVVLADYEATESSMLSVSEGEVVEVLDHSRNDWCLVRPATRPHSEGWVPAAYLAPYRGVERGQQVRSPTSPHYYSLSTSDESDVSTEMSERSSTSPVVMSPEALEVYDSEEHRAEAEERRRFVLSELSKTEQDYVQKLHFCLKNYDPKANEDSAPRALRALRNTLFGNLEDIYMFHKSKLLPKLLESEDDPTKLGDVFVEHEAELCLYVAYCQNKVASDQIYHDFSAYFEECSAAVKDRQKLPDYLILPVQRITKYGLLLGDFQKYSVRAGLPAGNIDNGLEVTRRISTQANNAIHLSLIDGPLRLDKFGSLVLQDLFSCQESYRQTLKERRVFLFERALLITKRRRKEEKEIYAIKERLMLYDVSMVHDMDTDRRNLIVYDMLTGAKFLLRAIKTSLRDLWLSRSSVLIQQAKKDLASHKASRSRCASEPVEFSRVGSFSRGKQALRREREGSKRKLKRPNSSSGVRMVSPGSEEMMGAGTQFVVMECIVLEGEDDLTLEPGEVVELVRDMITDAPLLRVRTMDDHRLEGSIPSSYVRKKDSIKGLQMESTPKFTMHPTDLDLSINTTATISCAFNGYPAPSVIWRRDHEILTSDERRKVTSCSTSSVLEVRQLEYDDEGRYACYITNPMGSDSTFMALSLHGPPSEPQKPVVSKVTSTSVKLKWAVPDMDGSVPILSYQIEMLQEGFDQWQPIVQQPRNYFVVKTLEPSTSYRFRVSAVNEYGFSSPSEISDPVVTKGKGLLVGSPSFRKHTSNTISPNDEVKDLHDDDQVTEDMKQPFIRKGSVSSMYDIMPEELGRGRFGIVHCCQHRQSGLQFAAKFVRLRSRKKAAIRKEVEILHKVRGKCPHILEYQDAFERGRNLIIVTELVPSGEILESVVAENNLTEAIAVKYLSQLLHAVDTLHKIKIAHLDIRPENILLTYGRVKLIDFGTARDLSVSEVTPLYVSSVEFCAPEVVGQNTPTFAADMWSVGVFTYVLLSGLSPFFADNIQAVVDRIIDARYSFYNEQFESISQEAKDFISTLLQKSPEYRLGATDALKHSWIKMLGGVGGRVSSPWPMAKLDMPQLKTFLARRKWHTSSVAVDDTTVYGPRSMTCFSPTPPDFEEQAKNEVPPQLFDGRTEVAGKEGSSVTLDFKVSGSPIPSVAWVHEGSGEVTMSLRRRVVELSGGTTSLTISELRYGDEGLYVCSAVNNLGSVSATCKLTMLAVPGAPTDVNTIILGSYNSALISWLPPATDGHANISKYHLERCRLEYDAWEVVATDLEAAAHVVDDLLPGVPYIFRVSAINEVGIGPCSDPSEPVTIEMDQAYDSDSPSFDQVRMKMTPFDLEYDMGEEMFKGSYSRVLRCRERTTDYEYVAKVVNVEGDSMLRGKAWQETDLLRELTHPRIVRLEDSFDNRGKVILVLEYIGGGTLAEYVASHGSLTEYTTTRLLRKLLEGMQYLHEAKIIHVNLTPDNVLLTAGYSDLKIGGFGTARFIETGNQLADLTHCGVEFQAPEVVTLQPITTAADIWSMGVLACYMVAGQSPFLRDTDEATISAVTSSTAVDLSNKELAAFSAECKDFVCASALAKNPRRRMAAQQCLKHKWMLGSSPGSRKSSTGEYSPSGKRKSLGSPGKRKASLGGGAEAKTNSSQKPSSSSPTRKHSVDQ